MPKVIMPNSTIPNVPIPNANIPQVTKYSKLIPSIIALMKAHHF